MMEYSFILFILLVTIISFVFLYRKSGGRIRETRETIEIQQAWYPIPRHRQKIYIKKLQGLLKIEGKGTSTEVSLSQIKKIEIFPISVQLEGFLITRSDIKITTNTGEIAIENLSLNNSLQLTDYIQKIQPVELITNNKKGEVTIGFGAPLQFRTGMKFSHPNLTTFIIFLILLVIVLLRFSILFNQK